MFLRTVFSYGALLIALVAFYWLLNELWFKPRLLKAIRKRRVMLRLKPICGFCLKEVDRESNKTVFDGDSWLHGACRTKLIMETRI